jgi:hypothetical protein
MLCRVLNIRTEKYRASQRVCRKLTCDDASALALKAPFSNNLSRIQRVTGKQHFLCLDTEIQSILYLGTESYPASIQGGIEGGSEDMAASRGPGNPWKGSPKDVAGTKHWQAQSNPLSGWPRAQEGLLLAIHGKAAPKRP